MENEVICQRFNVNALVFSGTFKSTESKNTLKTWVIFVISGLDSPIPLILPEEMKRCFDRMNSQLRMFWRNNMSTECVFND